MHAIAFHLVACLSSFAQYAYSWSGATFGFPTTILDSGAGFRLLDVAAHPAGFLFALSVEVEIPSGKYGPLKLWKLLLDGTPDKNFGNGTGQLVVHGDGFSVGQLFIQRDGNILVNFGDSTTVTLLRFHPDGSLDPSFSASIQRDFVSVVGQQSDGKLVLGTGERLNVDGSSDLAFLSAFTQTTREAGLDELDELRFRGVDRDDSIYFSYNDHLTDKWWRLYRVAADGSFDPEYVGPTAYSMTSDPRDGGLLAVESDYDFSVSDVITTVRVAADGKALFSGKREFLDETLLVLPSGDFLFFGGKDGGSSCPGHTYRLESSSDLRAAQWQLVATATAGPGGDVRISSSRENRLEFYRAMEVE